MKKIWIVITESSFSNDIEGLYTTRELAVAKAEELISEQHDDGTSTPENTEEWTYKIWYSDAYNVVVYQEDLHEN